MSQRACLVSLPWDYYQSPSIAIGSVASYARARGFEVDARHLHLECAALFGLSGYSVISHRFPVFGEAICAALLLPDQRKLFLEHGARDIADAEECCDRIGECLRSVYESHDWSSYHVVGFTIHFAQLFSSLLFASWVKHDNPDVKIVLGGGCITERLGTSILDRHPHVDYCVHGDGEGALVGLLTGLEGRIGDFEARVPGLLHRAGAGVRPNPRSCLSNLRGLPDPDYDHYFRVLEDNPELGGATLSPYMPVELSRGCRHRCAFCNFTHQNPYRPRPSAQVASSIKRLVLRHRTNAISLMALMIPPDHADRLFRLLTSHHIDYRIFCEARAGLSKRQLEIMKRAGVTEVQIGIEALDSSLLRKMNKGNRFIDNLQIMKFCEELGIRSSDSFLMLGFPTESQDDIDRSVAAVDSVCAYAPPGQIMPFSLRHGSLVDRDRDRFGVYDVRDVDMFSSATHREDAPRPTAADEVASSSPGVDYWLKEFKSRDPDRDYSRLMERIDRWRKNYRQARMAGQFLLSHQDCGDILIIEDYRDLDTGSSARGTLERRFSLTLSGWRAELYRVCDSIRTIDEIAELVPEPGPRRLRQALHELVERGVLFHEDGRYLALAVASGAEIRHKTPFPWA